MVFAALPVYAAISVGPSGTGIQTFDATPAATEWSTLGPAGGAGDLTNAAALDLDVTTNLNAASITTVLPTSSTLPLSANALARRNTGANWLQTCPTGVKYTVLMATLQNNSGGDLVGVDISYDFGNNLAVGTTLTEEIPGHRVFYSQTGTPNSWALAASLSSGTTGQVTGTLNLGTWTNGALLYVLWVDDNASPDRSNTGTEEGGYTIDNWVAVGVQPPRPKDLVFQQGLDGYAGAQDTYVRFASADTAFGFGGSVLVDGSDGGGEMHGLIRFDQIFGAAMTQIPPGSTVRNATLTVNVSNAGNDMSLHRMLVPWDQTNTTWNILIDGVSADGIEAAASPDVTVPSPAAGTLVIQLPISTIQDWSNGTNNYGWVLLPAGTDGVDFFSSEALTLTDRPKLSVGWGTAGEPSVKGFTGHAKGFTLVLEDGNPPGDVVVNTVAATFNGAPITTTVSKAGTITTITYNSPGLLAAGSSNNVSVTLKHTGNQTLVIEQGYVVPPYNILPGSLAVTGVDTSGPGFRVWPYQSDGLTLETQQPNDLNWTEDQIMGLHGNNTANLATADASGSYTNLEIINYSIEAGVAEHGNFTNDVAFPGIPGIGGATGNSAVEVITFLHFPAAGAYRMGVNSDDGFQVKVGKNPRDRLATVLGQFNGGRGAADTLFDFIVEQAGYYAFRLLWENGNGELPGNQASCEWFTIAPDGTKVLVNDLSNTNSIRAYYTGPTSVFVKWLKPLPGAVDVPLSTTIDFVLGNGSATVVNTNSIVLRLNGGAVTPAITQPPGTNITLVSYDPPGDLAPEETNTVRLVFSDNGLPAYSLTNEYIFVTEPTIISLVAITDTNLWRYEQSGIDLGTAWREKLYDDSAWPEGAALLGVESGGTPEPMRTTMTLGSHITYYFRIRFNYSGPAGIRLRLRHVVDDGAVFYLNGTEVHRFGIAAGATFSATTPFADHENEYEGPFLIPTAPLVQGTNVLAVEVHQTSTTSSDMVFGAVLDAITSHLARHTVESITPAPNATEVPRTTPISLNIVDGTSVVQANSVQMWVNDQPVSPVSNKPGGSSVTSVSYNPGTSLPFGAAVTVRVQFTDNGPVPNTTTNQWTYTTSLETLTLAAIDEVTLWRYEVNGLDLGTAWRETNYNDGTWPEGAALLADETGATVEPIRTPFARNGFITFYFRTRFNFARSTTGVNLRLRHVLDDGAVFYLNGVEVNRSANMPPGAINYLTPATQDQENAWRGPFNIPASSLVTGTNVLAVEVHQNSATSSDVVFGAELTAIFVPPPIFTSVSLVGGGLRLQWTGTGTLEQANTVTGSWSTAPSQNNPQIVPTIAPGKFYRIRQ